MSGNPQNNMDDLSMLVIDPSQPFHHLNLAGEHGWPPDPFALAQAAPLMTPAIAPNYGSPDMSTPSLRPYDLQMPAITHYPEFTPDPDIPDLTTYNKPYSVDWPNGEVAPPEIAKDIASDAEVQASLYSGLGFPLLAISHDVRDPDPPLPDLQHPQLTPDNQMQANDRPGELDSHAISGMKADAHSILTHPDNGAIAPSANALSQDARNYQQTSDAASLLTHPDNDATASTLRVSQDARNYHYPLSQMNAKGNNSRRARHMGLLTDGIDGDR